MASKFLNLSTDNTLGGSSASDVIVPSQKAIKDYVDNQSGGSVAIDNSTITKNSSNELQTEAVLNMNTASGATNPLYHWQGTLAEYTAQNIEVLHPDWVCIVTDDSATITWGDITGPLSNQTDLQNALDAKQAILVSGTNIKTVNGNSLVGSGNVDIDALPSQTGQAGKYLTTDGTNPSWNTITIPSVDVDGISINRNTDDELQTIGVINQNDTTTAIKTWTGTKAQYEAIVTKDANTLYNITDDTDVTLTILEALYPVGSVYITTANSCPLSSLISGSTWTLISSGIVQAGDIPCKGNGMTLGLTDGTHDLGFYEGQSVGAKPGSYNVSVGTVTSGSNYNTDYSLGITTDETKSGIIADTSSLTLAVNIFERTA